MPIYVKYLNRKTGDYDYATVKDIGDISKLNTTVRTNVVDAINSIIANGGKNETTDEIIRQVLEIENALTQLNNGHWTQAQLDSIMGQIDNSIYNLDFGQFSEEVQAEIDARMAAYDEELTQRMSESYEEFTAKANALESRAESSERKIEEAESSLEEAKKRLNNIDIGNVTFKQDIDQLKGEIITETGESKIDLMEATIIDRTTITKQTPEGTKVSSVSEELSLVDDRVAKAELDIIANSKELESKMTFLQLQEELDTYEFDKYGLNLLTYTRDLSDKWNVQNAIVSAGVEYKQCNVVNMYSDSGYIEYVLDELEFGNSYTISIAARVEDDKSKGPQVFAYVGEELPLDEVYENTLTLNGWVRVYNTFVASDTTQTIRFYLKSLPIGKSGYLSGPKVELGTKATPWRPHIDDDYSKIIVNESVIRQQANALVAWMRDIVGDENGTVSEELLFSMAAGKITGMASTLENIDDRISEKAVDLVLDSEQFKVKAEKTDIAAQIGDISLDNRNRVLNSNFYFGYDNWTNVSSAFKLQEIDGTMFAKAVRSGLSADNIASLTTNKFKVKNNERLLFGVDVLTPNKTSIDNQQILTLELFDIADIRIFSKTYKIDELQGELINNEPSRLHGVYVIDNVNVAKASLRLELRRNGDIGFTNVSLQQGSIGSTDWSLAPEDELYFRTKLSTEIVQTAESIALNAFDEAISEETGEFQQLKSRFEVAADGIEQEVSNMKKDRETFSQTSTFVGQYEDRIVNAVEKNGVIQSINMSSEEFLIDFRRVNITGELLAALITVQALDIKKGFRLLNGDIPVIQADDKGNVVMNVSKLTINSLSSISTLDGSAPATKEELKNIELTPGPKGEDGIAGKDGVGVSNTKISYATSASGTVRPNTWVSDVPVAQPGAYIWTRTEWTYTDGTNEYAYSVSRIGKDGNTGTDGVAGKDGVGISNTLVEYTSSTSGSVKPTSGWTTTIPTVSSGNYLWTKITWTYTDKTKETGYSVAKMGEKGDKGEQGPQGVPARLARLNNFTYAVPFDSNGNNPSVASIPFSTHVQGFTNPYYEFVVDGSVVRAASKTSTWTMDTSSTKYSDFPKAVVLNVRDGSTNGPIIASDTSTVIGVRPGVDGKDAYTVVMGNESHTFAGDVSNALAGETTVSVIAYKGETRVSATIGSISGLPVGMSSAIYSNGTTAARVTFTVTTAMKTTSGSINIPITVDGKVFTKVFNYTIALKGVKGDTGATGKDGIAGKDGVGIKTTTLNYASSTNGTTAPTSGWTTTIPTVAAGNYLWTRTTWTYTDNSVENGYTVSRIGKDGNTGKDGIAGKDGVGISKTVIHYASSTNGTTAPTSGWATTVPSVAQGSYLWTRTTWTYTDGTNETGYSAARMGADGAKGAKGENATARNFLLDSKPSSPITNSSYPIASFLLAEKPVVGETYTITIKGKLAATKTAFYAYNSGGSISLVSNIVHQGNGLYYKSFNWINSYSSGVTANDTSVVIYPFTSSQSGTSTIEWVSLVKGSVPLTEWVPAHEDIYKYVDDVEIGGRNYALRTSETLSNTGTSVRVRTEVVFDEIKKLEGKEITMSFEAKSTHAGDATVYILDLTNYQQLGQHTNGVSVGSIGTSWKKYSITTKVNNNISLTNISEFTLAHNLSVSHTVEVRSLKIEKGNKATDWSPAPEDVQSQIDKSVKSTDVEYYLSTSNTGLAGGSWQTTAPAWVNGRYMWSRTKVTLNDGTTSYNPSTTGTNITGAKGSTGSTGAPGKGVSSITEEYYLSDSKTSRVGGSWTTTAPTWSTGKYMWTRSKIVWNNPTDTTWTTPIVDNSWEAVNEIEVGGVNIVLEGWKRVSTSNYMVAEYFIDEDFITGQTYTAVFKGTKPSTQNFGLWQNTGSNHRGYFVEVEKDIWKLTFTSISTTIGNERRIQIYQPNSGTAGPATIEWFKVVKGNKTSNDWQENLNDSLSGGDNLLKNSNFYKTYTGSKFTVGGVSYNTYAEGWAGYNGGISNPTTNYHAHIDNTTFNFPVIEYNESNGNRGWKGINASNLQNNTVALLKKDANYNFSVDVYATGSGTRLFGGFYYFKVGGTQKAFHSGQFWIGISKANSWHRVNRNIFLPSDADTSKDVSFYIYGYDFSSNSILYISNVKLAEGNKISSWSQSPEDTKADIDQKADGSTTEAALNEAAAKLQVLQQEVEAAATANQLKDFIDKYNKDMASRDKDARESESSLSTALASINSIQTNMGDMSATWQFIDRFIKNTPQGIVVGNDSSGSYILIKENRLSFYSNGQEVAFISQNLMEISRGAFVEQIQIAKYQFEESTTNHLTIRYVG